MLKLRLTRLGRKKTPFYRIVAMEALQKRDGKAIEYLGNFDPLKETDNVTLKEESILKHLLNGAQATQTVKKLLVNAGVWAKFEEAKKK